MQVVGKAHSVGYSRSPFGYSRSPLVVPIYRAFAVGGGLRSGSICGAKHTPIYTGEVGSAVLKRNSLVRSIQVLPTNADSNAALRPKRYINSYPYKDQER